MWLQHIGEPVAGRDAPVVEPVVDWCRCYIDVSSLCHSGNQLSRGEFAIHYFRLEERGEGGLKVEVITSTYCPFAVTWASSLRGHPDLTISLGFM